MKDRFALSEELKGILARIADKTANANDHGRAIEILCILGGYR